MTPALVEAALDRARTDARVCRRALRLLASILGAEAGNAALRSLATGGVYLGGGIPPRILPLLRGRAFREGFLRKGPMSRLMARIPVHVILEPRTALLGAARYGMEMAGRKEDRGSVTGTAGTADGSGLDERPRSTPAGGPLPARPFARSSRRLATPPPNYGGGVVAEGSRLDERPRTAEFSSLPRQRGRGPGGGGTRGHRPMPVAPPRSVGQGAVAGADRLS